MTSRLSTHSRDGSATTETVSFSSQTCLFELLNDVKPSGSALDDGSRLIYNIPSYGQELGLIEFMH